MRKAFVATAVVVGAVLVAGLVTSGSPALNSPGTIRVTTRAVKQQFVDRGPRGRGSGDLVVKRLLLYNKGIRARAIGFGDVVCTYTNHREPTGPAALYKATIGRTGTFPFTYT